MDNLIGVIGCGGLIGEGAVRILLENGYKVRGGQRRKESIFNDNPNFCLFSMDIFDPSQLDEFCNDCTVIFNCAGPSYKIKDKIAIAAQKANAVYVDMSDILITESSLKNDIPSDGVYVVGTGYVPGISGILLNTICAEFDKIHKIQGFQAGRQYYSRIAFYDILLSSMSEAGYPDAYFKNGQIVHKKENIDEKRYLPGMPESVYLKPYLPRELIDLAEKSAKIDELHWYNCLTDKRMMDMIMQSYILITSCSDEEGYQKASELYDDIFLHMEKMKNWSAIMYEVSGIIKNHTVRRRYILHLDDSNIICGIISANTVMRILQKTPSKGIYWAKDIINYVSVEEFQKVLQSGTLSVLDVPLDSPDILVNETESDFI